tara:strand:- start:257 stop:526 length:270 start_codon:yes stop_codon:yes gene_type:complete
VVVDHLDQDLIFQVFLVVIQLFQQSHQQVEVEVVQQLVVMVGPVVVVVQVHLHEQVVQEILLQQVQLKVEMGVLDKFLKVPAEVEAQVR